MSKKIQFSLEETGEVEVYCGSKIVCNAKLAKTQAVEILSKGIDAIVLNIPVFAFPNYSVIAAHLLQTVNCAMHCNFTYKWQNAWTWRIAGCCQCDKISRA